MRRPWRRWLRAPWMTLAFAAALPPGALPPRERLLALVQRSPGITVGEARAQLRSGWGSFYCHLNDLQRERLIETVAVGHRSLLYPEGHDKSHAARRAILLGATVRKIAMAIREHPGSSVRDIILETGESPRVVYHHVRRLAELELVIFRARTSHHDIWATDLLHDLLDRTRPQAAAAPNPPR